MFTKEPDKDELRQGDIIQGLFYPEVNCSDIQLIGQPHSDLTDVNIKEQQQASLIALTEKKQQEGLTVFTAQIKVYCGFFIIISQCCDLAKRDKGKPNISAFIASPLLEVPYTIRKDQDKLYKLQSNSQDSFINFFYILEYLPLSKDYVVDFNRVVALPRSQYDFALSKKILQMADKERVKFKLKLGTHFTRATQEELDAGIYPQ